MQRRARRCGNNTNAMDQLSAWEACQQQESGVETSIADVAEIQDLRRDSSAFNTTQTIHHVGLCSGTTFAILDETCSLGHVFHIS